MPKEQIILCIDNSEYMRNGDYSPSRMDAQLDAANLICGAKTQQNPETTLGIMTTAGKGPQVHVSPTTNLGQLLSCLSSLKISGNSNFGNSLRVAQLALKRRSTDQSQNGARRIIAFIASPLKESEEELEELANKLKKNNISVDVVNFGEEKLNTKKLEHFIKISNGEDDEEKNCTLVTFPAGPQVLSDILLSSPIVQGTDNTGGSSSSTTGGTSSSSGGQFAEYGGIDPNVDPDLAMAIKMSMEEEKRRQEKEKSKDGNTKVQEEEMIEDEGEEDEEMDEEAMMQQALALSLQENQSSSKQDKMEEEEGYDEDLYGEDEEDEDLDEDMKLAMALSMKQPNDENVQDILQDDDYLNSVLDDLPGVDMKKDKKGDDKKDEKK
eukprot:gene12711-6909_t